MPDPIPPSMRKVLDDIATSQTQRAEATASAPSEVPARGTGERYGTALDDHASAQWRRQEEHLLALRQEAAEQTRLAARDSGAPAGAPLTPGGTCCRHLLDEERSMIVAEPSDGVNSPQVVAGPWTRAARAAAVEAETLQAFVDFFGRALRTGRWSPWHDLPVDEMREYGPRLSTDTIHLLEGFLGIEEFVGDFVREGWAASATAARAATCICSGAPRSYGTARRSNNHYCTRARGTRARSTPTTRS